MQAYARQGKRRHVLPSPAPSRNTDTNTTQLEKVKIHSKNRRPCFELAACPRIGHRAVHSFRALDRENVLRYLFASFLRVGRLTRAPRKQIPLADSERLRIPDEAFDMLSSFRDGQMSLEFGEPGPPSGDSPTTSMQVPVDLSLLLTGMFVLL